MLPKEVRYSRQISSLRVKAREEKGMERERNKGGDKLANGARKSKKVKERRGKQGRVVKVDRRETAKGLKRESVWRSERSDGDGKGGRNERRR